MVDDGWKEKKLGDICNFYLGLTYTPKYVDEGVPFLSVKDITKGYLSFEKTKYISYEEFESSTSNAKPKKGDVIFGRVGTLGRPLIVETDIDFCIFVSLGFIRVKDNLHNRYLKQWMSSNDFTKQVDSKVIGSAQKNLNVGWLRNFIVPLPPLKEQEKIADILSTADDKIDAIATQIEKAETLKKGLLQKLLSEGIGHSEFKDSELGKIPESWEVVRLGEISKIKDGTHFSPKSKTGPCKYVTSKNIRFGYFNEATITYISQAEHNQIYKRCPVKKGQVLLTKDGANTGNACLNPLDEPFSLLSSVAVIDGKQDFLDNRYLLQWLLSSQGQKRLKSSMAGQAITRLTLTKISAHKLILPPLFEQKQIANILSSADEKLNMLKVKKEKYETLKKGLLQKLLSGEVRVGCCTLTTPTT